MNDSLRKFEEHPELEKGQSIFRIACITVFITYSIVMYAFGWKNEVISMIPSISFYLAFSLIYLFFTTISPAYSSKRRFLSILLDQFGHAFIISNGTLVAPFVFSPAVASIGTGLRYGPKLGYLSSVVSIFSLGTTMYFSEYWRKTPVVSAGIVLGVFLLPIYANALSVRLTRVKRETEARATEMEDVAREAQKQLRQHQVELAHVSRLSTFGEMASGIAHEINQPLTAIMSYNEACIRMLRDEEYNHAEIIRAMSLSAKQAERAGDIIRNLRSFVKKQAPKNEITILNDVVINALVLIEHVLRDNQVVVRKDFQKPLLPVFADSIQLEQVVMNLIRNAIDALCESSGSDRKIFISTSNNEKSVTVEIRDNGPGISPALLPQLFHPFFTTKVDGLGLGLVISQSIVENFDGNLVARNSPDKGAIFSFILPAYTVIQSCPHKENLENA